MKFYKHILLLPVLMLSVLLSSCEDKFDYSSQIIGEGESLVQATLEFKPSVTTLGGSRTVGNAISNINTLAIVIYNAQGELVDLIDNVKTTEYKFKDLTPTTQKPSDYPNGANGEDISSDNATAKVQFEMKLPYGRYYMYAVANLGKTLTPDEVQTIDKLKAIECTWNANNISANAQMFGYFTNDVTTGNTAFTETDPTVTVNKKNVALHSWIKRLASKVTIAFDGSGLHQGIVVYIHNVSIRQIPLTCTLGEGNKPTAENQVSPARFNESVPDTAQVLYYNNDGFTNAKSDYDYSGEKYLKWLQVANGAGPENDGHLCYENQGVNSPALFFYENMQGVHPDKPKEQQRNQVGTNVGPADNRPKDYISEDYKDGVEFGTFIEVEAYYQCNAVPSSSGPIRYRFMLGQNTSDDYNAIRNRHYKLTLGFIGYANQPDWHIEYVLESPEIYAPEIYIPYTYNTSVPCPITFNGNLTALEAEIIENNWAPYDSTQADEVPPATVGSTNFTLRTLQFNWYEDVYMNGSAYTADVQNTLLNLNNNLTSANNSGTSGYLYGRHFTGFYHLNDKGEDIPSKPYYVTPIWAGFLRLQVPAVYADESDVPILPAIIVYNRDDVGKSEHYWRGRALTDFRNYYYGEAVQDADENKAYGSDNGQGNGYKTGTDLSKRIFNIANPEADPTNKGRNAYIVDKNQKNAKNEDCTVVTMNLWTQPKSMCGNSGFSGNNPYEDYNRRAVIRFTATFKDKAGVETIVKKDVTVYQSKRLVNPKAVWHSHDNQTPFNVTVYERKVKGAQNEFQPLVSRGAWRAKIKQVSEGDDGFIYLTKGTTKGDEVEGNTLSEVKFTINFDKAIGFNESKCAIVEVTYHGNTCVHNIFVRQGYHQPMQITTGGRYWSSYNLFSCDANTLYNTQNGDVQSVLTSNPLAFGAFFKRLNYARAISESNITRTGSGLVNTAGFGPLQYPGMTSAQYPDLNTQFNVTGRTETFTWNNISGNTTPSAHWTTSFKLNNDNRTYHVPEISDFQALQSADFGIGVLYGDGATAPADSTQHAYGFLDANNTGTPSKLGMRGFICYNSTNAHQIFFPIGTSGIGRRTIQLIGNQNQRGTLRYGSTPYNLTESRNVYNTMRPIPYNMENAPGSIYWAHTATNPGDSDRDKIPIAWDMNYFDLNFTSASAAVVSRTSEGGGGDALPIRLVTDTP